MRLRYWVFCLSLVGSACASIVGTRAWYDTHGRDQLFRVASFDLNCRATELNDQPLHDGTTQIGVEGCGQRAVYIRMNGMWLKDSASKVANRPGQPDESNTTPR